MVYHSQTSEDISHTSDTIAAIATPAGVGAIGIIRLSGRRSVEFAHQLTGSKPLPRRVLYRRFLNQNDLPLDVGILLYFPAPNSYTGEDVCEIQCHGGPVILNSLLDRLVELGARPAQPGEFTRRAFLNNKLDLAQAEAVVDLINSSTAAAAQSAVRSLQGDFSKRINKIHSQLLHLRVYIEAAIDFPEEEIDFLADLRIAQEIAELEDSLDRILQQTTRGCVLREGIRVAVVGLPNAGKSSLFNKLAKEDRVIVTPQPGTTRDTIDVMLDVSGLAVKITDTAGLRYSEDAVEVAGIRRTWQAVQDSDFIFYVVDSTKGLTKNDKRNLHGLGSSKVVLIWNKTDLDNLKISPRIEKFYDVLRISALTGQGINDIYQLIQNVAENTVGEEGVFLARRRHLDAINKCREYVVQAGRALTKERAGELAAQDLRDAMNEMGKIVGIISSDDLLGEIFASFCIGK